MIVTDTRVGEPTHYILTACCVLDLYQPPRCTITMLWFCRTCSIFLVVSLYIIISRFYILFLMLLIISIISTFYLCLFQSLCHVVFQSQSIYPFLYAWKSVFFLVILPSPWLCCKSVYLGHANSSKNAFHITLYTGESCQLSFSVINANFRYSHNVFFRFIVDVSFQSDELCVQEVHTFIFFFLPCEYGVVRRVTELACCNYSAIPQCIRWERK